MTLNTNTKSNTSFNKKQAYLNDLDQQLSKCNSTDLAIINNIYKYCGAYGIPKVSQGRIADNIGVRRETVNKKTTQYHKNNIILKTYNHRHPNNYFVNPQFFDFHIRQKWQNEIPALKWVSPILLQSRPIIELIFGKMSPSEYVTPLNKNTYLKEHNTHTSVNTSTYVGDKYTNVRNYKEEVDNTNRKGVVLSSYNVKKKESVMLKKLTDELNLGSYEVNQLAVFSEDVLKHSYVILQNAKNITNKFKYLMGICKGIESKRVQSSTKVKSVVKKNVEEPKGNWDKINSAVDIANELVKINAIDATTMYGGDGYKKRMLYDFADKDYVKTEDEYEAVALGVIDKFRIELGLPPRLSVKNKPGLDLTNENSQGNTNTHKGDTDTSNVKFDSPSTSLSELRRTGYNLIEDYEHDDNYEEVYD